MPQKVLVIDDEKLIRWTLEQHLVKEGIADGDRVTNVVNGKVVNEASGSSVSGGHILVQSEGAEIYFRRIDVEPLAR